MMTTILNEIVDTIQSSLTRRCRNHLLCVTKAHCPVLNRWSLAIIFTQLIVTLLTPNVNYSGRTAPLTS